MGWLSSIFGGGSSGSSTSTTTSSTDVTVNPVTNIAIPLDELAEALLSSAKLDSETNTLISQAELQQNKEAILKNTQLQMIELEQSAQFQNLELEQNKERNKQILLLGLFGLGIYAYKKGVIKW